MKPPKFPTRSILVTLLAIAPAITSAYATTIDWTGANGTTWATGTNWTGGTAPANDLTTDIAQFNQVSYVNQPVATSGGSISGLIFGNTSTATGAVTITTSTNASRLNIGSAGILVNSQSGAVTISSGSTSQGVQLGASQTWTNNSASTLTVYSVSGQTAGGVYGLTINGSGNVTIAGAITNSYSSPSATGSLSLTINTTGGVTTLSATGSAFTGDTTLTSGVLALNVNALQNSALNTAGTGTITTNQTKPNFGGLKGSRDLSSVITSGYGSVTLVTLNPLSGTSTYSGVIANGSAGMGVTKTGAGTQVLGGANTYTGKTTISAGSLIAGTDSAVSTNGAFGNASTAIVLGDAATTTNNSSLSLLTGGAFTIGRAVTIANQATTGTYTIGGNSANTSAFTGLVTANQSFTVSQVTGGTLNITGGITGATAGTKTVTFNNVGAVNINTTGVSDGATGNVAVVQAGAGTTTLSAASSYTGATTISAGTLQVDGTHTGAGAYAITGATLAGSGNIAASSGFSFGLSGNLTPGAAGTGNIGTLTLNGPVAATAATTFSFDIGGAGNTYDIVKLASLNATNITLNLTNKGAYTFAPGDQLHLFENTSGANTSISGTFSSVNLPSIAGLNWDTSALYTSGYISLTAAIPEPSTYAAILGALTFGFVCVRRRRYPRVCAHSRVC